MQSCKNKVASFSDSDGGLNGLKIAHLADENDIRVFTEDATQGGGEAKGVIVNFALSDDRALRAMGKLNRVFDGNNVGRLFAIDFVNESGESGGFTGTGRTGDENEATRKVSKSLDDGGHAEVVDVFNLVGDETESCSELATFVKGVNSETSNITEGKGVIKLFVFHEDFLLLFV